MKTTVTLFDLPAAIKTFPFIQVWHRRRDNDKLHQWFRSEVKDVCSKIKEFLNPMEHHQMNKD
ncbi:MAG: hypothetical protein A2277_17460 [Desulfobacterales bacterium RIFOXYA12_FULL_46_15]|nr:MAG: hypothetical protein A2277_17460 [Desulfobacterales bacterium RIFOXYA12_FULL_46_15]